MLLSLLSKRSLEVDSRDSYGFALRPQHAQRYREYDYIYKEEEGERSDKWGSFLERIACSSQQCSENEHKEKLKAEGTNIKEEITPESVGEGDDSNVCKSSEDTEIKEEPRAQTVSEGENSSGQDSAKVTVIKEETSAARVTEGEDSSCRSSAEGTEIKEEKSAEGVSESEDSSGTNSAGGTDKKEEASAEVASKGDDSSSRSFAEDTEIKQERVSEGDDSIVRKPVSDGSTESHSEKEVHRSEERKTLKVQTWAEIRQSLTYIDKLMSSRVKKGKNMKGNQIGLTSDHRPSVEGSEPQEGVSKKAFEGDVRTNERPDDSINNSTAENVLVNQESPKFLSRWKELESLVQGGVPKDLRGEVWQAFVGVKTRRVRSYYENLLDQEANSSENKEQDASSVAFGKWRKQIEKDIPRTFPGHPALTEHGRNSLRRVLLAYARHNPSVGYCQAMNFFAGLLLLLMPEENAFWVLVGIIDDYFEGYYTEEMIESQVDQLVFEELMRERFPKLVNHLDYLGVQVAWISGPWFLSIFVNIIPWESVLRVWDVLLFEGNRVMLFRTALALMELFGPALVTTKDAGDAITLLQSLAGSTFDSSQLVFTACMGYLAVTEAKLQELREKHRPSVVVVVEERSKKGRVWKDSKGLATKLYSFKHDRGPLVEEKKTEGGDGETDEDKLQAKRHSSNLDELLNSLNVDSELDSLPDLQEQVVWLKVELCRLLEEKRSAVLRAEELETALMEMVQEDNRRQLSARVEQLEQEVAELRQALADKKEEEVAMLEILLRVEQEQKVTEDARSSAEQEVAAQKYAVHVLQEKYDKAMASIGEMEKRVVMAESMLEATLQYESGQSKALSSPRAGVQSPKVENSNSSRKIGLLTFGLGWRDRNKGKPNVEESGERGPVSPKKETQ
ncbi:hypothetical protein L6164_033610 [Bauhinia variegata]|uniref:Uncharacterized protein n=1 Tax=Bauhinia variegata TaxID=167791 RepID=A0ACB9KSF4_BAUVA|nr:hypothetical protein L6164_033610 [Bauhinia variegata]